ncbi:MAG: hypothetical protein ABSF80_04490 [Chitinispirillaceae bacterium]
MIKIIAGAALFVFAFANSTLATDIDTVTITIIASGETHAMLYPCDCPNDPGGGLAERAAVLKKNGDPGAMLLLDAGGFAGGGIYDDATGGRSADSQRTLSTVRAMGMMKYDAAAIGDDDLQYGGTWLAKAAAAADLRLISANCFFKGGKSIVPSYRVVVKKGIRFAVTALTTPERLFPRDDSCMVLPPVSSLRKIWKEMGAKADYRVILSHLGEEMTAALADSFPECDIIVNGHRKSTSSPASIRGRTLIMQFGYQGKKLSSAKVRCSKKRHSMDVEGGEWLAVGPAGGADSAVGSVIRAAGEVRTRAVYDLYIMGQCPYGCTALREFIGFVKKFPDVEWNVWFIGSVIPGTDDSLSSLHGSEELNDEMTSLAVKTLYPDRWLPFLAAWSAEGGATRSVMKTLRLDTTAVAAWVRTSGRQALADHFRRSMRLNISASPTLLINNAVFEKAIESGPLARAHCLLLRKSAKGMALPAYCDSLPDCFDDNDCRKKGMTGQCLQSGKCGFTPDAPFPFTALVADSTVQHPERTVIATTEELFPNVATETVTLNSAKGRMMMKTYDPPSLPFYLFGDGIARAHNFSRIESGLKRVAGGFVFKDGITPKNYFPQRRKSPHALELFIDPLFAGAAQVIRAVCSDTLFAKKVRIAPVIYADPKTTAGTPAIDEKIRREEALRWLVLDTLYHDSFLRYISQCARDPGSSYWFINLSTIGIAQDVFIEQISAQADRLFDHWRLLDGLGIRDPIALLIENREVVVIKNEAEFASVLASVQPSAGNSR